MWFGKLFVSRFFSREYKGRIISIEPLEGKKIATFFNQTILCRLILKCGIDLTYYEVLNMHSIFTNVLFVD